MQNFYLAPTRTTFEIKFDQEKNILEFKGKSYPSNAFEFFKPIIIWIEEYLTMVNQTTVKVYFQVNYFNTSSSKYLFEVLELFNQYYQKDVDLNFFWVCEKGVDDIFETWKEMMHELDMPFEIIHNYNCN